MFGVTERTRDGAHPEASPDLDISLRHLFVFKAVAQEGSAAGAAGKLFRANSAIARSISALESSLRVRLFDRHARGMLMNAYGRIVLQRVERIAKEFDAVSKALDGRRRSTAGASARLVPTLVNGRRLAIVTSLPERHSMAAVARECRVTQAAVSACLRSFEDRLGVTLFARSPKGLVVTDIGKVLTFHFRRALAELRHIGSDLAAVEGTLQGVVRIGALPLGRTRILPRCIASTLARYPLLRIATIESPYDLLAAQLRSGEIDFVFGALRPADETADLLQDALFDDCVSVIARVGHPLVSRQGLTMRDLRGAKWVLWRPESPSRKSLHRSFRHAGLTPPQASVETGDLAILRGLILQSDMLTAISADQLRYEIASGDLVVLPIDLAETRRGIGVTLRQGALPSPGTRALLDEIRVQVDRMIKEGELLPVLADPLKNVPASPAYPRKRKVLVDPVKHSSPAM
jgi:LysR family transcriptional regulator of gallate degradation